jgi:hypothetical protein
VSPSALQSVLYLVLGKTLLVCLVLVFLVFLVFLVLVLVVVMILAMVKMVKMVMMDGRRQPSTKVEGWRREGTVRAFGGTFESGQAVELSTQINYGEDIWKSNYRANRGYVAVILSNTCKVHTSLRVLACLGQTRK